jgi:hypothetical protein
MNKPVPVFCTTCRERSPLAGLGICAPCVEYDRLLSESLAACPETLSYDEFARFMRKLSIHAHATRPPKALHVSSAQMEEALTVVILEALPLRYVSVLKSSLEEVRETGMLLRYTFKTRLPREELYRTVEKLGLWSSGDDTPA